MMHGQSPKFSPRVLMQTAKDTYRDRSWVLNTAKQHNLIAHPPSLRHSSSQVRVFPIRAPRSEWVGPTGDPKVLAMQRAIETKRMWIECIVCGLLRYMMVVLSSTSVLCPLYISLVGPLTGVKSRIVQIRNIFPTRVEEPVSQADQLRYIPVVVNTTDRGWRHTVVRRQLIPTVAISHPKYSIVSHRQLALSPSDARDRVREL